MTRKTDGGTRETNERNNKSFVRFAIFACFVFSLAPAAVSLGHDQTSATVSPHAGLWRPDNPTGSRALSTSPGACSLSFAQRLSILGIAIQAASRPRKGIIPPELPGSTQHQLHFSLS